MFLEMDYSSYEECEFLEEEANLYNPQPTKKPKKIKTLVRKKPRQKQFDVESKKMLSSNINGFFTMSSN